jgi:anaerobic magnesium-protoporphyrin IX monomethyl ester cyclase
MDILLIDPPYISLKGMSTDRGYNMGLTSLAAYLRRGGVEAAILTGDLFMEKRPGLLRPLMPAVLQNMSKYAAGQREYARIVADRAHPVWKKIADTVRRTRPGAVGIAYFTPSKHTATRIAALVKEIDKEIKVIAGSFHPTFCPEEVLQSRDIDFVVRGEGEIPLLELLKELKKDRPELEKVPGISYRDGDGRIINNQVAGLINNLDELPFPARDLVLNCDYNSYRLHSIATTRGCPYTCSFCADRRLWGGKVRRRSVANVLTELHLLKNTYKISYVDIVDGTFTFDRKYLQSFCNALLDQQLDVRWRCTARYDNLDREILTLMKRAGCSGLYFGLESGSERILKSIDKKITLADIVRVNQIVRDTGILADTSVLLGLPDEGREDIEATLSLMRSIEADEFDVNSFIPLPGTSIWDAMSEEEKKNIDWLKVGYKSYDNYFSKELSREEFAAYRDEAYKIAGRVLRKTIIRLGARALFSPVARVFGR